MPPGPPRTNGWANCSIGHGTGRAYQNFPDQKLADPLRSYYGQNLPRLRDVKRHYDPDNFFCHQQSIPLGTDKTDS